MGANPIAEVLNQLGLGALILLLACLACTPLRLVSAWTWPARVRRTLGLLAFTWAALHVLVYAVVDQGLAWRQIVEDVSERRFVFVGFAAFVLLVPLALTSTRASVRRMGFVRWSRLHWLVYPSALLACVHFLWRVKRDVSEPLLYGGVLAVLLVARAAFARRRSEPSSSPRP